MSLILSACPVSEGEALWKITCVSIVSPSERYGYGVNVVRRSPGDQHGVLDRRTVRYDANCERQGNDEQTESIDSMIRILR